MLQYNPSTTGLSTAHGKKSDVARVVRVALGRAGLSGAGLLVAVSGGLDSTALARLLAALWREGGLSRLEIAHLDHALRADSARDADFCRELADSLGVPFHAARLESGRLGKGQNLQAEARRLRKDWLDGVRRERGLAAVALAHHADDQAETVLFRLLRGVGPRGAGGMREWAEPWVRPLLGVHRGELHSLALENGWQWREDPSNRSLRYSRNRVRHELLPAARRVAPGADGALLRFSELCREDDDLLTQLALADFERLARREPEGISFSATELSRLPPPLRRRVLLAACRSAGGEPERLSARHIEEVERLLEGESPRAHRFAPTPEGVVFARSYGELWVLGPSPPPPAPLPLLGEDAGVCPAAEAPVGALTLPLPPGRPAGEVVFRRRLPGDRLGAQKVKDLLMEARLPLWRRKAAVVAHDGEGLLGVFAGGVCRGLSTAPGGLVLWLLPR